MKPSLRTGQWAFGALLLFLFLVYANPGNWFDEPSEIPYAKIAAGLALVTLAGSVLLYHRRLRIGGAPGMLLVALFVLVGVSAIWSYWPRYSFDTFTDGLKYLAMFFVVVNVVDSTARLRTVITALALATLIPAFGAITSWMRGVHLVDGDRAAWIGIFANPNELAYHLVVGVALTLAARDGEQRSWRRIFWLVALIPIGVAILLTQSRGGMLSASTVIGFWLLRSMRRAPAVLGVAIALLCVFTLGPNAPWQRRNEAAQYHGEDMSARGRVDAWRTGMNIAAERPLTGVGAGAFMIAWPSFAPGDAGPPRTAHNTFVQLVSELGFPGLTLFVAAFLAGLFGVRRATHARGVAPYASGIEYALVGFGVCSISTGLAFSWPLYILLGLAFAARQLAPLRLVPIVQPQRIAVGAA